MITLCPRKEFAWESTSCVVKSASAFTQLKANEMSPRVEEGYWLEVQKDTCETLYQKCELFMRVFKKGAALLQNNTVEARLLEAQKMQLLPTGKTKLSDKGAKKGKIKKLSKKEKHDAMVEKAKDDEEKKLADNDNEKDEKDEKDIIEALEGERPSFLETGADVPPVGDRLITHSEAAKPSKSDPKQDKNASTMDMLKVGVEGAGGKGKRRRAEKNTIRLGAKNNTDDYIMPPKRIRLGKHELCSQKRVCLHPTKSQ
eukprot:Platyproteum_vivax@DN7327_c0_g1_i2.p1